MRILSWNINGIRTLPQYHPWNTHKTGEAILTALEADIICFQEMKIQRTALEKHMAMPEGFDSYFSFPVAKGGYSGVAVYAKSETVAPFKAEEGLTGTLQPKPPLSSAERVSTSYPQAHEMDLFPDENDETPSSLASLDHEGRALVVDFGLFVLINVYCPAETSDTRLPYKMNFHRLLEEHVRRLVRDEGREVIVLGDINVAATPLDHCDGHLPSMQADFWGHPPRAWLRDWLAPVGPMIDAVRHAWPDRKGMYTCWNTKISARESNYGSRIDYVLLTSGLLPWFKHGDIQAAVRGSDHCPVYVELHDEIRLESGQVVRLRDAMRYEEARRSPPRISARFWKEFSGKQRLLSNFFAKKNDADATVSTTPEAPPVTQGTVQPAVLSQQSVTDFPSSQPEDLTLIDTPTPPSSSNPSQPSTSPPLASGPSSSQKNKFDDSDSMDQPKKKKRKVGQTKLSSFFVKPSRVSSSRPSSSQPVETPPSEKYSQLEADYNLARSLSENFELATPRASSSQSKAAWTHLLAPLQPPKCRAHGEPCKEFTVNKPGPNKGKAFFICSRAVGPGYDKGRAERLREEVDGQYRCDFFKWASDVKREALKVGGKCEGDGGAAGEANS